MVVQRRIIASVGLSLIINGLLILPRCTWREETPTLAALTPPPTKVSATPIPAAAVDATATAEVVPKVTFVPTPFATPTEPATVSPTRATDKRRPTAPVKDPVQPAPTPSPLPWILAYDSDVEGNDEIYLVPSGGGSVTNLTRHSAEDRYPSWSPDGRQIAFQSNRNSNWDIYTLDLETRKLVRLTYDPAYDGSPTWSPDGQWIYFDSYRDHTPCPSGDSQRTPPSCPNLEIYRVKANGGRPQRLTNSPGGDHQPAVSPNGQWIAFTSWREGDKDIYVMSHTGAEAWNVTAFPGDDWSPVWSKDGTALVYLSDRDASVEVYRQTLFDDGYVRLTTNDLPEERPTFRADGSLLFSRYDPGASFELHNPHRPGAHRLYHLSSDGKWPHSVLPMVRARHPAAAPLGAPPTAIRAYSSLKPQAQLYRSGSQSRMELRRLGDIVAPDTRMVEGVDDAYQSWRAEVRATSGHDFLARLSDAFRPAGFFGHYLGYLSWHKTGRAVDLLFDWRDGAGQNALIIVREDMAGEVYWRLFLKCTAQDGSMGEPLTTAPWRFWWHLDRADDLAAVADGGRKTQIPPGYYVDVTALAARHGWHRIASYQMDEFHWRRDSTATEYWHYQRTDGLTWYEAMSQLYSQDLLDKLFSRSVAAARSQTKAVMDGKGLPESVER